MVSQENCGIIALQKSVKSSSREIVFTINLGVVSAKIADINPSTLDKVSITDACLRQRVGMLLPDRTDKWWKVTERTDCEQLTNDVVRLILNTAVPYVNNYISSVALKQLWESGQSPGFTVVQRDRALAILNDV